MTATNNTNETAKPHEHEVTKYSILALFLIVSLSPLDKLNSKKLYVARKCTTPKEISSENWRKSTSVSKMGVVCVTITLLSLFRALLLPLKLPPLAVSTLQVLSAFFLLLILIFAVLSVPSGASSCSTVAGNSGSCFSVLYPKYLEAGGARPVVIP